MKKNFWKPATSTIPGPVDFKPITVPADESIPDEAFNAEPVPVPGYEHVCVISLTCRVDDESTETIEFYSDDRISECKKKLRKIVMNGWPVESFEQNGILLLNTVYLEKFFKALGTLGGTLDTSDGYVKFIPFADTSAYFWDLVGE